MYDTHKDVLSQAAKRKVAHTKAQRDVDGAINVKQAGMSKSQRPKAALCKKRKKTHKHAVGQRAAAGV